MSKLTKPSLFGVSVCLIALTALVGEFVGMETTDIRWIGGSLFFAVVTLPLTLLIKP